MKPRRVLLMDIARVIRSKNAGPYELTCDIICRDPAMYAIIKEQRAITPQCISELYGGIDPALVSIIYFDPAAAVKITMPRRIVSGSPGETDIYGAQQHAPLLTMEVELHV